MVFDRIENIGTYLGTGEAMDAALNFLKVISEEGFDESREYDPGCGVLVRCAAYTTRPLEDCCFEAHRRYIDVMAMLSGTEQHMPCICSGEAKPAKRLILKVPVQD